MYKSYPSSVLYNNQFDKLTDWLNKLTSINLSGFDAKRCRNVDEWLIALEEQTPLYVPHTSGTSGTFSFLPRSKKEWDHFMHQYVVTVMQQFGKETPPEKLPLNLHGIYPYYRSGGGHLILNNLYVKYFCGGDESRFHAAYPGRLDSDILLLGARIRKAASMGELDRLQIDPQLLARREEFMKQEEQKADHVARFFEQMNHELRGERVFLQAIPSMLYNMAEAGLKRGDKGLFARDSIVVAGGGAKGAILPPNWYEIVEEYVGAPVNRIYGMGEMVHHWQQCSHDNYHLPPGVIPYILHPVTSQPYPRTGVVTGRMAHYDLVVDTMWGGFITGDEVTMHWDDPCGCGRSTPFIEPKVQRYSEKTGAEDKITCAATAESYTEAMDFLIKSRQ
jgi:hypothetical protein